MARLTRSRSATLAGHWDTALAILVCALLFAHSLMQTFKLVYLKDDSVSSAFEQTQTRTNTGDMQLEAIRNGHLFGGGSGNEMPAPQPTSGMELHGAIVGSDPTSSFVILSIGGAPDKSYKLGETLPNGSVVKSVTADQAVISTGSSQQELLLHKKK